MSRRLKIYNGQMITPSGIAKGSCLLIRDGLIEGITEGNPDIGDADELDAAGKYISPGFIDIHLHGGGGHDFMDNSVEAFLEIAKLHARHGTTAMVPTTLSADKDALLKTLECYEPAQRRNTEGAQFIGIHIEGPYFSMDQKGAQDPRYIRDPDPQEYRSLVTRFPTIRRWSAAPELKGAIAFGQFMRSKGVLPSIAHTNAIFEEVSNAFDNGFTHITHLYSAMSGVSRRNAYRFAGVIESAYIIDEMTVEMIADGSHLPASLLKLVHKIKGAGKIALITDAMRAAGTDVKESILGSLEDGLYVIVEDGVAKLPDRSAFAGSVATADQLLRNILRLTDIPLTEAVAMLSSTPASIMHVSERKGSLGPGKDADIVIFDQDIHVDTTIINGNIVWQQQKPVQA